MKLTLIFAFTVLLSSVTFAQNDALPETLRPDKAAESEARNIGAEVFKLMPRGMYKQPPGSYKDEDNAIGVREGGAYYSFLRRSHSYNQVPQIGLERKSLKVGFAGMDYGFIADLGNVPLSHITQDSVEAVALISYQPPKYVSDIREEQRNRANYPISGITFNRQDVKAVAGHTYLLRAINFEQSDQLVAFNIQRENADGSLLVFWKPIKEFEKPIALEQPDSRLLAKLRALLEPKGLAHVLLDVKDNVVFIDGRAAAGRINEVSALINPEGNRGVNISFKEK